MKNILLLTDFSENAQNAIVYALQFFKGGAYKFFILNVQKVSNYSTGDLMVSSPKSSVYDTIIKNPKSTLIKMVTDLETTCNDENYIFESVCDYDAFVSSVSQTVRLKNIDLIVMGTNGATSTKEVVFGSNTLSVIRNVNCPVLVIPQGYEYVKPTNVLLATEYDEIFDKQILKPLMDVITKYNTELYILMLSKTASDKEKKNKMAIFFKDVQHSFYSITNIPTDIAIDCFVQLKQVDIIAKVIHKKSFFNRLFSGSTTDEITYNSKVPLLIMHS